MTFFDHHGTYSRPDADLNFPDHHAYFSMLLDERNTIAFELYRWLPWFESFFFLCERNVLHKLTILRFLDLWELNHLCCLKMIPFWI